MKKTTKANNGMNLPHAQFAGGQEQTSILQGMPCYGGAILADKEGVCIEAVHTWPVQPPALPRQYCTAQWQATTKPTMPAGHGSPTTATQPHLPAAASQWLPCQATQATALPLSSPACHVNSLNFLQKHMISLSKGNNHAKDQSLFLFQAHNCYTTENHAE